MSREAGFNQRGPSNNTAPPARLSTTPSHHPHLPASGEFTYSSLTRPEVGPTAHLLLTDEG